MRDAMIARYTMLVAYYNAGSDEAGEQMARVWWVLTRRYGIRPDGSAY